MKTYFYIYISIFCMVMFSACGKKSDREYLSDVLGNMDKVKSVKYHCVHKTWEPGDKDPIFNEQMEIYEHVNPEDTVIGYSYIRAFDKEFKQPLSLYDGIVHADIVEQEKEVCIDNFTRKRPLPFRMVQQEAFYYMKAIIDYALNTNDSIILTLKDEGKDYLMELTINMPNQVEFFGKAKYIPENPYTNNPVSVYKIWISKENDMPYRYRREMQHNITEAICSDFLFNPSGMGRIIAEDYYPEGYVRYIRGQEKEKPVADMTGKTAPEWTLTDIGDRKISLSDIKSKVVLLQFIGIGCGPCKISIHFLNRLREKYDNNSLEIIAVETWVKRKSSCENYIRENGIKYRFLTAEEDIIEKLINDYHADSGVPKFYLLDENRSIRKICNGYAENSTDEEIEKEICNLLK